MECRHVICDIKQRSRGSRKRYSMCRGDGAARVSRSYRYISLFWCFVESRSGAVVSLVSDYAVAWVPSLRSSPGRSWHVVLVHCGFLTGTRLSYSGKYGSVSVVSGQEWSHIVVRCTYQLCVSV